MRTPRPRATRVPVHSTWHSAKPRPIHCLDDMGGCQGSCVCRGTAAHTTILTQGDIGSAFSLESDANQSVRKAGLRGHTRSHNIPPIRESDVTSIFQSLYRLEPLPDNGLLSTQHSAPEGLITPLTASRSEDTLSNFDLSNQQLPDRQCRIHFARGTNRPRDACACVSL